MTQSNNIENIKDWFTFVVAVITCVAGVIFWVQSSSNPKIEKLEKEINAEGISDSQTVGEYLINRVDNIIKNKTVIGI